MRTLSENLKLDRCPHCGTANPNLRRVHHFQTQDHTGGNQRMWSIYVCSTCGSVVPAWAANHNQPVQDFYPKFLSIELEIPERPRAYLKQASESIHAPAGAVMLAASAVDSMLKAKGYAEGSLYVRIDKAAADHVITPDMAAWAHAVRLDANDQRHADEATDLPSAQDAKRVLSFAATLAQIMFVLPSRVARGLQGEV
jgi:DNA-directed RNA polymerase subunit RPC12/RpoP